jgi:hypothetical protein
MSWPKFDFTVNIGNMVVLMGLIISGISFYTGVMIRISAVEMRLATVENAMLQIANINRDIAVLQRDVAVIRDRVERLK